MRNLLKQMKKLAVALLAFGFMLTFVATVNPSRIYADTSYTSVIDDQADFLSDDAEAKLNELFETTTQYCNAVIVTTTSHSYSSTDSFAANYYEDIFGNGTPGVIFVIDRDLNKIHIVSEGKTQSVISSSKCLSITDNTYIYATSSYNYDYDTCAIKTFEQINTLLEGGKIFQPMKIISNLLLSLVIAMLVNYFLAMSLSRSKKPSMSKLLEGTFTKVDFANARSLHTHQTKKYSPRSSSSSGGSSGGGGGGGGHSGGGHSI